MDITKSHGMSQASKLSVEQRNAIDLLVQGKSDQETAEATGVRRETVCRWRNKNPLFMAELNRRRKEIWEDAHEKLRNLVGKAVDTLDKSLDEGNLRAAISLLKLLAINGNIGPPKGPDDPVLVLWKEAEEWAKVELARRGPSEDPVFDLLTRDSAIVELARQRMVELLEEHRQAKE